MTHSLFWFTDNSNRVGVFHQRKDQKAGKETQERPEEGMKQNQRFANKGETVLAPEQSRKGRLWQKKCFSKMGGKDPKGNTIASSGLQGKPNVEERGKKIASTRARKQVTSVPPYESR